MEQSTIALSSKSKQAIVSLVIVLLTAVMFLPISGLLTTLALVFQIGLFSAIISSKPKFWQALLPLASYGVGYLFTNSFLHSVQALMYLLPALIIGWFLRKSFSRSATVVVSSFAVGVTAIAVVIAGVIDSGVVLSVNDLSATVTGFIESLSNYLMEGVPNSLFENGITKEMYIAFIQAFIKQFAFSFAVIICNIIAFSASAVTKRTVRWLETEPGKIAKCCENWNFVLSKPSAVVFVLCSLCLLVGGETLTLPQVIAFSTVKAAIQCGLIVMACRTIREKFRVAGFASILVYLVMFYFFKLKGIEVMLSITGMVTVFKRKSKEAVL